MAMDLALTARAFKGDEALLCRLVSRTFPSQAVLLQEATKLSAELAGKSPLATTGTKRVLLYQRYVCIPLLPASRTRARVCVCCVPWVPGAMNILMENGII